MRVGILTGGGDCPGLNAVIRAVVWKEFREQWVIALTLVVLGGGLLVMLGWRTPAVAFVLSGEMAVAYFMSHHPRSPWPIQNGGELAALYSVVFLFMATRGSGAWGIERTGR